MWLIAGQLLGFHWMLLSQCLAHMVMSGEFIQLMKVALVSSYLIMKRVLHNQHSKHWMDTHALNLEDVFFIFATLYNQFLRLKSMTHFLCL
ncbi:unnamed protein product [Cuscuta campestris]|uniref:Uncharacterized protein n=1 Tax=Cuscuta campestris TaxID=132261 RepID=A0A484LKG7_9ASTE|nr:unnamed protein product [Cuscuta campestris]